MKKIIIFLVLAAFTAPLTNIPAQAALFTNNAQSISQNKEYNKELKSIKALIKLQNNLANKHDLKSLKPLYTDNYVNNDGFNLELYFKNVEETWAECKDLTYDTKILSVEINGDYAAVNVEETAFGTIFETVEDLSIAGEIHSKSTGIYHLNKIGGKWFISGETLLTDESSLLYGDARFMNIELNVPSQVGAGESYTSTLKVDTDENTFIIASIERDPVTYPSNLPKGTLRAIPQTNILERVITANNDNINEYSVASLAISKTKGDTFDNYKIYMAGLACIMKRVNVIPKNNFLKSEDKI